MAAAHSNLEVPFLPDTALVLDKPDPDHDEVTQMDRIRICNTAHKLSSPVSKTIPLVSKAITPCM